MSEREKLVATVATPKVDEVALEGEVTDIEVRAATLVINSEDDYRKAGEFGRAIKQNTAKVMEFFKPMKDSAHRAHKEVCDREKAMLAPLRKAEQTLKAAMSAYIRDQEEKRRQQEAAARKAAEEERERLLNEAISLEEAGDIAGADMAMQDAEIMDEAAQTITMAPAKKPKADGVSTSKDWEIVSIDDKTVPLAIAGVEIRPVDRAAVMRLIRSSKGKIQIPGIEYRETAKMSFRR